MKALVFDGESLRFDANYAEAIALPGEALISPKLMGICSTDLEIVKGYMGFTGVLGHEFVGVVEAVGSKKDAGWIGKRVVGNINCVCGECDLCKKGLPSHCRDRTVLGIAGRDGCFAERFCLPVGNLLAVPENLSDEQAVFAEPVATAYQILRQLTIEGRPYITILGDGRLGLLCAQVLMQMNATVRLIGKHPEKMALCERWGIKHRLLEDVGLRNDQDVVVDCTGSRSGMLAAMGMVRPRGKIVMKTTVAVNDKTAVLDLSPIVINEIEIIGSRCGPMSEAIAGLSSGAVDVLPMISKRMKLVDGVDGMVAAQGLGVVKVLLEL